MQVAATMSMLSLVAVACGSEPSDAPGPDAGAVPPGATAQRPPQGDSALRAWLAAGDYLSWTCESAPHAARPPSAHGMNRICSNTLLSTTASGEFPVDAASVKELHGSSGITGYAVGIKIAAGSEPTSWYWYELIGTNVVADSPGAGLCANCHEDAPRDYVFTRVE